MYELNRIPNVSLISSKNIIILMIIFYVAICSSIIPCIFQKKNRNAKSTKQSSAARSPNAAGTGAGAAQNATGASATSINKSPEKLDDPAKVKSKVLSVNAKKIKSEKKVGKSQKAGNVDGGDEKEGGADNGGGQGGENDDGVKYDEEGNVAEMPKHEKTVRIEMQDDASKTKSTRTSDQKYGQNAANKDLGLVLYEVDDKQSPITPPVLKKTISKEKETEKKEKKDKTKKKTKILDIFKKEQDGSKVDATQDASEKN